MGEPFIPKQAYKHNFAHEDIVLKENHADKPFWVNYDGIIILETFSPYFKQATDFLIAIAEPVSRPAYIHEYKINAYSLYAAASVGLTTDDIINTLDRFSKNNIPRSIESFIKMCTLSYGKIKLILKNNRYYIEAVNFESLSALLKDKIINECRISTNDSSDEEETEINFEIDPNKLEILKKRCIEIDYPLIEEYDFKNDYKIIKDGEWVQKPNNIQLDLKPLVSIRTYQEISLNKMFGNGRARSGIIVLPCGAGKTLVGITAICTIKKSTLILCTSGVSVEQWREQLIHFTTIKPEVINRFTSDRKETSFHSDGIYYDGRILITTYTMLAYTGKRSSEAQKIMNYIKNVEWGLLIFDEVHVVPAMMFRKVISLVNHHCKLGLTATLLREDDKIEDLNFLIGPKLYEADWQHLSKNGHIANVECIEVWCKMSAEFYREYLNKKRKVLSILNPNKFQACEYLINLHEKRGDKIIVFSDNVFALKTYAYRLNKPFIYGPTGQSERMRILKQFRNNPNINTILLSKVGDTSIDIPEATCIIQISSHFGSRRQEAQRLGRILRAKRRNDPGFKVHFYTLVSKDTDEMFYSNKRQQFLIDQGYSFKILTDIPEIYKNENRTLKNKLEQKELLATILLSAEIDLESEESEEEQIYCKGTLRDITGVGDVAYMEKKKTRRHTLFKKFEKK
ncbi:DNA repair helicase RAD25 protein [Spraguea lophii 42_110]|uniref:DNA 3'-5' helicase n=1 Tax=Spraguea lophii (strain 42_110) TaxID=1358809 RepID=S7W6P0_SPRLO|nr:DNA repair helicase RAD25 protein [Spraguea lophii 42_110]